MRLFVLLTIVVTLGILSSACGQPPERHVINGREITVSESPEPSHERVDAQIISESDWGWVIRQSSWECFIPRGREGVQCVR